METVIIVALVGPSGCGKTTLGKYLKDMGFNWISSYTTRPMREGETDGVEHKFVSTLSVPPKEDMVAYADFGGYQYWSTYSQFTSAYPNVYTIDEGALLELEKKLYFSNSTDKKYCLIKCYIDRKNIDVDEDRQKRDSCRINLPECYYDVVFHNDGDLNTFLRSAFETIVSLIDAVKFDFNTKRYASCK